MSLPQARDRGIDVRVIAHWTSALSTGDTDINGVMATAASGITYAEDLEGTKVAVDTLDGMGGVTTREAVRKDGGDPDKVQLLELGFPDMPAALAAGNTVVSYSARTPCPGTRRSGSSPRGSWWSPTPSWCGT